MHGLPPWLLEDLGWLEQSQIGEAVRMTPRLYPILESLHIIGIAITVGAVLIVDLRLLGIARHVVRVTTVTGYLLPLSRVGFALVAASGLAMFVGIAVTVASSAAVLWKLGLIFAAGLNVAVFHTGVFRTVQDWDLDVRPPARARVAALVSAATWSGVVFAGRLLAYV